MKKKWAPLLVYLFFMLAMALAFVNLDDIVGSLFKVGDNDLRKVDFSQYEAMGKDPLYFRMDPVSYEANDFETAAFSGECFAETEDDNSEKTITILLRGENICYASERRSSMGAAPAKDIGGRGYSHSFARQISLLPISDGEYEVWLFDRENDTNYGLVNTKQGIIKDRDGIRPKEWEVSLDLKEELCNEANWSLDYVREEGSVGLFFSGWAFQEDTETLGQTIYLKLSTSQETKYIECVSVYDKGVSLVFGNEKYEYSRFHGHTGRTWIGDGPLEVSLILENEEGFHGGNRVYRWDPTVEETLESGIAKSSLLKTCPFDPDDVQPALGHLDLVQKEGGQITISGWAAAENQETGNQKVYLEIQTENGLRYAKCFQTLRTGVGDVLGSRLYDHSGYKCSIAVEKLPSSGFDFQIFVENEAEVYTDGVLHHYDIIAGTLQSGAAKPPLLKTCPFDREGAQLAIGFLDLVQKENGQITVSGWAAAENRETGNQTVYLEIQTENGPRYAKCSQVLRTGVGDALGSRLYDHSGYTCSVAVENLPSSGFDFQVFVENEAGVYTDGVLHHYDTATEDFQ